VLVCSAGLHLLQASSLHCSLSRDSTVCASVVAMSACMLLLRSKQAGRQACCVQQLGAGQLCPMC
jgi:hypothetical protein